jgi:ribonucleotide reductase beta subunit family protein with ferritin-like domain
MSVEYFEYVLGDDRLTTYPINRNDLWQYYTKARNSFWTPDEINIRDELDHFTNKLTTHEQHFVKHVLAFFAASDGIVNVNLAERFKKDVKILEAGYFYDFQIMMENIHAETYSNLLESIISSPTERDRLFNAIKTIPSVSKMSDYMMKTISSDAPFPKRLLRMACVEGIFFSGCFCAIYWLQSRGLMPALGQSNELISRDEGLHTMFALYLYTLLKPEYKLQPDEIVEIFVDAVEFASQFINEALPVDLPEMNSRLMLDYIKSQADILVSLIDHKPIYGVKHQFAFMDQINMDNVTNFFERRVTNYSKTTKVEAKGEEISFDF